MKKFLVEEWGLNILSEKIVWENFIINKKVLSQESVLKIAIGKWGGKMEIRRENLDWKAGKKNFFGRWVEKIGVVGENFWSGKLV